MQIDAVEGGLVLDASSTKPAGRRAGPGARGMRSHDRHLRQRFGNAVNFQGEPFLPGNDLLARYPSLRDLSISDRRRIRSGGTVLLGVPFRLHGRDPETGLDCVGWSPTRCAGRAARGSLATNCAIATSLAGPLWQTRGPSPRPALAPGDLVYRPTGRPSTTLSVGHNGFIQAHAGLDRVVIRPPLPWPIERQWRLARK